MKKQTPKVKKIKKMYEVEMSFNCEKYTAKNVSLKNALKKLKPKVLSTEMYISISYGEAKFERRLNLIQGRKLWADEETMDMFINNFTSLYGN